MTDENDESEDVEGRYQERRIREWVIFVVGGFIGSSFTYYLGPPVLWVLSVFVLAALVAPFFFGEGWI